jgi:pilus assembly protein CpaC
MKRTSTSLSCRITASLVTALAAATSACAGQQLSSTSSTNAAVATAAANSISNTTTNAAAFLTQSVSGRPTPLIIGHSVNISTAHRMTRVYVTNPNVLTAYTATPNQVLVTAKDPGVSSLMIWDESGTTQTYMFSSDLDVDGLRATLKAALPNELMTVDAEQGHIVLSGSVTDKDKYQLAEHLAGQYSKDVSNALIINSSGVKQVRLKVRILEVDRSRLEQLGFNLFSAGGNTLAQSTTNQFPSSLTASTNGGSSSTGGMSSTAGNKVLSYSNPLNFLLYNANLNIGAMVQDLENRQVLQILAEPNITTISGEKANFLAGGEFPFPVVQGSTGGLSSITIQFRPYGVKLEFTPIVNSDGSIQLKVAPEVSALDYTNAVQISGYTIPALSSRRAETQVVLKDGQSFAISGLLDQRTTDQLGRTPGIASIPILGALFKSKSINHSRTELLVLVTPDIVDPSKESLPPDPHLAIPLLNGTGFDAKLPHAGGSK